MRLTLAPLLFTASVLAAQVQPTYSTYFGGAGDEFAQAIVDSQNNTYVAGQTYSAGFPVSKDSYYSLAANGYVIKFDSAGAIVFAKAIPDGRVLGMTVDPDGFIYVTGSAGRSFEPTPGAYQTSSEGGAFVSKITASGETVFSTFFGRRGSPRGTTIALDTDRNPVFCGSVGRSFDAPVTETAIFKAAEDLARDPFAPNVRLENDKIVVTGATPSRDFLSTVNAVLLGSDLFHHAFVLELDADGTLQSSRLIRTTGRHSAVSQRDGLLYLGGSTHPAQFGQPFDAQISVIDPTSGTLVRRITFGGDADDSISAMAFGSDGKLRVVGTTRSNNFPVTPDAWQREIGGFADGFLAIIE